MTWPTIDEIVEQLEVIRAEIPSDARGEGKWVQVRLQDEEGGRWELYSGDPQCDTDHGGFWGAHWVCPQSDLRDIASTMLEEAADYYYISNQE